MNSIGYTADSNKAKGGITKEVPIKVLQNAVKNGRKNLAVVEAGIERCFVKYPGIVAEGAFEGKSRADIIRYLYERKVDDLAQVFADINPKYVISFSIKYEPYEFHVEVFPSRRCRVWRPASSLNDNLLFLNDIFDKVEAEFLAQRRCFK